LRRVCSRSLVPVFPSSEENETNSRRSIRYKSDRTATDKVRLRVDLNLIYKCPSRTSLCLFCSALPSALLPARRQLRLPSPSWCASSPVLCFVSAASKLVKRAGFDPWLTFFVFWYAVCSLERRKSDRRRRRMSPLVLPCGTGSMFSALRTSSPRSMTPSW